MDFCPITLMLLEELTSYDELNFKSPKTGTIFKGNAEHTLLFSEDFSESQAVAKFRNTLNVSAYDPINPRIRLPDGCPECKRKILTFQRLGENKKVVLVCLCSHTIEM